MPATGQRIRVRYRGENMYVSVFPDKQEIFISMVDGTDLTMAGVDTIARLASKCWQAYGVEEVVKQLNRAGRVKHDMPSLLAVVLEDFE